MTRLLCWLGLHLRSEVVGSERTLIRPGQVYADPELVEVARPVRRCLGCGKTWTSA